MTTRRSRDRVIDGREPSSPASTPAFAWGPQGHRVIAKVAEQRLDPGGEGWPSRNCSSRRHHARPRRLGRPRRARRRAR